MLFRSRILFLVFSLVVVVLGKMPLWLGLFAISLAAALFWGRLFCGYACPMNTVMIAASWISKKLGWQTTRIPRLLSTRWLPWLTIGLAVAGMSVSRKVVGSEFPLLPVFLVLSIIITLRFPPEAFHNGICPFGTLQRLAGSKARNTESVDVGTCIGCKKCARVCPAAAISFTAEKPTIANIDPALCHQCADCVPECPVGSIARHSRER